MKDFYKFILVTGSLTLIIFTGFDFIISYNLQHSSLQKYQSWHEIKIDTCNFKGVIIGSSETTHSFDPNIIGDSLGLEIFNCSMDGYYFDKLRGKYNYYRTYRSKPDIIIINISKEFLNRSNDDFNETYFPFIHNPKFRKAVLQYSNLSWAQKNLPMYRYVGYSKDIKEGLKISFDQRKEESRFGFIPFDIEYQIIDGSTEPIRFEPNLKIKNEFEEFIKATQKEDITIFFVLAPIFTRTSKNIINLNGMYSFYQNLADKYHIPFLNYTNNEIAQYSNFFADDRHLNVKGTTYFSKRLGHDLKILKMNMKK